jgi:hypothetical protein
MKIKKQRISLVLSKDEAEWLWAKLQSLKTKDPDEALRASSIQQQLQFEIGAGFADFGRQVHLLKLWLLLGLGSLALAVLERFHGAKPH